MPIKCLPPLAQLLPVLAHLLAELVHSFAALRRACVLVVVLDASLLVVKQKVAWYLCSLPFGRRIATLGRLYWRRVFYYLWKGRYLLMEVIFDLLNLDFNLLCCEEGYATIGFLLSFVGSSETDFVSC